MTEVEFSRLLSALTETAKTLNKESDSLNEVIGRCEQMLAGMKIGLEVWVDTDPLESSAWTEERHTDEEVERGTMDTELGFAEVHGKWRLAVRVARYETVDLRDNREISPRLYDVSQMTALLDASRRERIAALKHLPRLIEAMKREAEEAVKAIQNAKNLVK